MTPEAQRIAIAEVCGTMRWSYALPTKVIGCGVPNYLSDLNAMHEAEKVLNVDKWQRRDYLDYLSPDGDQWALAHATAAQRAEAFLRTLNLWTD